MADEIVNENPLLSSQHRQPGSMKTISESKLINFSIGQQKKSRFQKAREEREQKQKEEEKEAAIAYESFAASFADRSIPSNAFVSERSSSNKRHFSEDFNSTSNDLSSSNNVSIGDNWN